MDAIRKASPVPSDQLAFSFPVRSGAKILAKSGREQAGVEPPLRPVSLPPRRRRALDMPRPRKTSSGSPDGGQEFARREGHAAPHSPERLPAGATMQDLLDLLARDPELTLPRRRNLLCSVRKFVDFLGLDLHMPAGFPVYRGHIKRFQLGTARIGSRRWANIRSDVAFALGRYGARKDHGRPTDLLPAWQQLRAAMPNDRFRRGLSRIMRWCSRQGIDPNTVDDNLLVRFHEYLIEETFDRKPDKIYCDTCKLWNDAVALVPGWPQQDVELPSYRKTVSLPRAGFPQAFWDDFQRYGRCRLGQDLSGALAANTLAKASTIEGHEKQLRRFASAMVKIGRPMGDIVALASLFERPWFENAIQAEHDRLGGPCPSLQELAATLLAMARNYLALPRERVKEIACIKRRLKCRTRGFTAKNRERLRSFRDPRNLTAFLFFGDKLLKLAPKEPSPKKAALLVQTALMHEILLVAPLRMENLTALRIQQNFRFSGPGRKGKVMIVIQGDDVKNGVDLEFELPAPTAELLRRYLDRYRASLLRSADDGWLFPGERLGLSKHQVSLSQQLCSALKRHTGLVVNPHLYRHIAAFFYLEAHPGDYETVRRLLGHTSLETTMMFYADLDRLMASRLYNEHILERRLGAEPSKRKVDKGKPAKSRAQGLRR